MQGARQALLAEAVALVRILIPFAGDPGTLAGVARAWQALETIRGGGIADTPLTIRLGVTRDAEGAREERAILMRIDGRLVSLSRIDRFADPALGSDSIEEPVSLAEWTDRFDSLCEEQGVTLAVEEGR